MAEGKPQNETGVTRLDKCPTGIQGLDEITNGGLPRGRPTLVCGAAGSGKTLLAMEFLVRGVTAFGEPGVFLSFEESSKELAQNVASLGFDLPALEKSGKLAMDHVFIERSQIEETGEYDLEALFIRLGFAIDSVGAKRVVLDTIEALFANLPNELILRSELRRLFRWLKNKGVTAVITAERGEGSLTRHGIEEYVSDAVILLDHRLHEQIATRRLRIVKYRGTAHGTDEYPFLIDEEGFSVLPVTSLGLNFEASTEIVSSGIPRLDAMLGGGGYYRGSSVLLSGMAGSGKTSIAAFFADSTCRRGEPCLYFALEESPDQIIRNMRSIGLDLEPWVDKGLLRFYAVRPTLYGLEMHLAMMHKLVKDYKPTAVVMDPISNLNVVGSISEIKSILMRMVDFFKIQGLTGVFTHLEHPGETETTESGVSSLMDTWLAVRNLETNGERNRTLYILKARGMAHSNQVREFILSDQGLDLVGVYIGPAGVLTGSARLQQEAREGAEKLTAAQELARRRRLLERKRQTLEAQIAALEAELAGEEEDLKLLVSQEEIRLGGLREERTRLATLRQADPAEPEKGE
jgi:circadian clock protein KaiC